MGWLLLSSSIVAFLAYWLYIHRQVAYNALILPPLPPAYFAANSSRCKIVTHSSQNGLKYCEDLTSWKTRDKNGNEVRRVIASCDPGRYEWNTVMGPLLDPNPRGSLWLLHTNTKDPYAEPLLVENFPSSSDFHPLGIDILQNADSPSTLFMVNHQRHQRTIEVFHLYDSPPRLVHIKQISHPAFWAPNSVAALSPNEFFVSIDHWFIRDGMWPWRMFMHQVESLLALPLGKVHYVRFDGDGVRYTTPVRGISFPNGLSLSHDKSQLAIASTTSGQILIYGVEDGGRLKWRSTIPTPILPDNLEWQEDGSLLIAGHPHFRSIARLAKRKQATSPTWLISLSNSSTSGDNDRSSDVPYSAYNRAEIHEEYSIQTIYQSDGAGWSAGTSGTWVNDRLVITGLYSEGLLVC